MSRHYVLIPAAGSGSRMGSERPKQYLPLAGKPMIAHTVQAFQQSARIEAIYVVLSSDDTDWEACVSTTHLNPSAVPVHVLRCGGATRAETVLNGLEKMPVKAEDWVLVHDAARPGITLEMLNRLLDTLQDDPVGGLLAIPLADTLKRADKHQRVEKTEPRESLWQAQTPQMFRHAMLKQALTQAGGLPTDEAQAIEALGHAPKLVMGGLLNLKVTYPQDLVLMETLLQAAVAKESNLI